MIETLISTISTTLNVPIAVLGGNRNVPAEYNYYRLRGPHYRFELYLHGNDLISLQNAQETVISAIEDFADNTKFNDMSVEQSGGGIFTKDNVITITMYFDVTTYEAIEYKEPVYPEGTLDITENGIFDITKYASVSVNVPLPTPIMAHSSIIGEEVKDSVFTFTEPITMTDRFTLVSGSLYFILFDRGTIYMRDLTTSVSFTPEEITLSEDGKTLYLKLASRTAGRGIRDFDWICTMAPASSPSALSLSNFND